MLGTFKSATKYLLRQFNIGTLRYDRLQQLEKHSRAGEDFELLAELPREYTHDLMQLLHKSRAEFRQDLFVLSELNFKKDGYFVEFGATNGISTSNTYLLDKQFGWRGILAEPAKRWHKALKNNRSCCIDTSCVWSTSNQVLQFQEEEIGECSGVAGFNLLKAEKKHNRPRKAYDVSTISLTDLLIKYGAPAVVDYLSIDAEGSEYEILKTFDFSKFTFKVITCEHGYTQSRERIFNLLTRHGYERTFERFSKVDDWYVFGGHAAHSEPPLQ